MNKDKQNRKLYWGQQEVELKRHLETELSPIPIMSHGARSLCGELGSERSNQSGKQKEEQEQRPVVEIGWCFQSLCVIHLLLLGLFLDTAPPSLHLFTAINQICIWLSCMEN